ncbi:MAG: N-6 DNA methylase [Gammaproteobacteria bacterium AqS3]|nr:N-6 DNA methylase [Gammaproteobacteria bacterium AqS3]
MSRTATNAPGASLGAARLFREIKSLEAHSGVSRSEYKLAVLDLVFLKYLSGDDWPRLWENISLFDGKKEIDLEQLIGRAFDIVQDLHDHPNLSDFRPRRDSHSGAINKIVLHKLLDLLSDGSFHRLFGDIDYEYFLSCFAASENIRGGEVFTPRTVVNALVEMIRPRNGTVYDPCCGSGGMFIEARNFIEKHGTQPDKLKLIGWERDYTTWRLAKINLAIQGIDAELALGDSFIEDDLSPKQADYILASPPFNMPDWGADQLQEDPRWKLFGAPPADNANYAWLQHIYHHSRPPPVCGFWRKIEITKPVNSAEETERFYLSMRDLLVT